MPLSTLKKIDIRIYAAIISVILCLIAYSKNDPVNYDGILYLASASAYLKSGITAAMQLYSWPFYSIVIAWLSKLTTLSLLYSAYLLNNIFFIIIATTFITLLKEFGASTRIQIIGAAVILIYPQLNDYRDFVVRDFGYWALFLVAFWQLLRFAKTKHWLNAMAWNIFILLAILFRIEGIILLLFAPLVLLFLPAQSWGTRIKLFLQAYSVFILGFVGLTIYSIKDITIIKHLGRIPEAMQQIQDGWQFILNNFHNKVTLAGNTILGPMATNQAPAFLLWGLTGIFIVSAISTITPLYILLAGYAMLSGLFKINKTEKCVLYYFTTLNLLIPAAFFAQHFFLSGRYLLAFCLLLALWAPFALEQLYVNWQTRSATLLGQRWVFPLIVLVLFAMASGGVIRYGHSKAYITQAGQWLANNTPANIKLYSNNKQVLFYANRTPIDFTVDWLVKYDDSKPLQTVLGKTWQGYDYMALRITHKSLADEAHILKIMGQPVQRFRNKRGDEVLIFKLK